jgi:hypothetical protein
MSLAGLRKDGEIRRKGDGEIRRKGRQARLTVVL